MSPYYGNPRCFCAKREQGSAQCCGLETGQSPRRLAFVRERALASGQEASTSQNGCARPVTAAEIVLDADFAGLTPPLSREERDRREFSLAIDGCVEPLIVWPRGQRMVLLVGYEVFPLLKQQGISFQVIEKEFATRDQARMFIVQHLLGRGDLGPLWVSYLRGLRYVGDKQTHGGDRRSEQARQGGFAKLKTAEALGEMLCVPPATICRDGKLVAAVHQIVDNCGEQARALLLRPASRLSRETVRDLAQLPPEQQRRLIGDLTVLGRLPRSWRTDGCPATISLPREARPMTEMLVRRLGVERAREVYQELGEALREQEPVAGRKEE